MPETTLNPVAAETPEELADALLRRDHEQHGSTLASAAQSFSVAARVRALLIEGIIAARTDAPAPEPREVEWNVRQHDGWLINQDFDDEPYTEETAREEAPLYLGGEAVFRSVDPWEVAQG